MTVKRLILLSLTAVTLTGCYDSPTETPTDLRPAKAELPYQMFDGTAFAVGDAYVLLATTNSGKLLEIDVDAGSVRQIGQSQAFGTPSIKPGWTGITKDASGTVFTTSRTKDDPRLDGCFPASGSGAACTHLYNVDPSTGLVTADRGSVGQANVSDIDGPGPLPGTVYGSMLDVQNSVGLLVAVDATLVPTSPAVPIGYFSTGTTGAYDGGFELINGGLSVDPNTGVIWGIENNFHWDTTGPQGPRLFTIDGSTGAINSPAIVVTIGGANAVHGFDGLEIMPDGRMFASRGPNQGGGGTPFQLFEINPSTGEATQVSLTIPAGLQGIPNGLETTTAPRALTLSVTSATVNFDPTGDPGGDDFVMDATFAMGAGNNGLDLPNEAFVMNMGDLVFTLPGGSFITVAGGFEYTSPGPGLTVVAVDEDGGTLHLEGMGLTLNNLIGAPVAVNLQMGDDVGESAATFSVPSGVPAQAGGEFYAVTNAGELLVIDLGAGTGTFIGTATVGGGGGGGGGGGDGSGGAGGGAGGGSGRA